MQTPTERRAFVLLLAIASVAFCWLILPRYGAIFWAIILAILFNPMNKALNRKLGGRRNIASLVSVMVCIFIVIIPMSLILGALIQEGASMYVRISNGDIDFNSYLSRFQQAIPPQVSEWMHSKQIGDLSELTQRFSAAAMRSSQVFARRALSFGQNTLDFAISLGIMLYLLFFLFRDGERLGALIRSTIPLNPAYTDNLLAKFTAVVRATVKGNVIIAIVQGAIGGVTFWFLGLEASLLWGVLMAFLSLLPAIGAAIVWAPVAAYLLLIGDYASGVILLFVGMVVIGLTDNVLRPPLVGKETKLPDYVVLISTVGGLSLFGINGFVMGPLIAALFISAWALFGAEQREEATRQ